MLTLTTPTDTMRDWIATGRCYMRAQLAADRLGLRFQPTSQVLQEYPQMDELRIEAEQLLGRGCASQDPNAGTGRPDEATGFVTAAEPGRDHPDAIG